MRHDKTFIIENAELTFLNFEGREGKFNKEGERGFAVFLPEDIAAQMEEDGWNIKSLESREEGGPARPLINVGVRFDVYPPRIILLTSETRTQLDEKSCEILDWADIRMVDLIGRAYEYNVGGKTGLKAYLQSMFVTIEEDPLERKYGIIENPPVNYG
jgi:hypothetical protein